MVRRKLFTRGAQLAGQERQGNAQARLDETNTAAPIGSDRKGRLTVLYDELLDVRGGKLTVNVARLKKALGL